MMKRVAVGLAIALVLSVSLVLLIGCPAQKVVPMSFYRGTVYGVTPYFNNERLSYSEAYYFSKNDVITINYTLTAEEGEDHKSYQISVGKLASEGGMFKIVDHVRDPNSIDGKYVYSQNERFSLIKVDD